VPHGQSPFEALVREGFEEAGLPAGLVSSATAGRVVSLLRDVRHGLQREHLHTFDLELPPGLIPQNQDGEVQGFDCLPVDQALALAASDAMAADAALVTLDFALRHRLCPVPPGAEHFFGAAA
jgi:8-oxo-dGTP pyrophosphatase MutT (NUDIX family)